MNIQKRTLVVAISIASSIFASQANAIISYVDTGNPVPGTNNANTSDNGASVAQTGTLYLMTEDIDSLVVDTAIESTSLQVNEAAIEYNEIADNGGYATISVTASGEIIVPDATLDAIRANGSMSVVNLGRIVGSISSNGDDLIYTAGSGSLEGNINANNLNNLEVNIDGSELAQLGYINGEINSFNTANNDISIVNAGDSNLLFNIDRATEISVYIARTNITNTGDHLFYANGNIDITLLGSVVGAKETFSGNQIDFVSDGAVTFSAQDYNLATNIIGSIDSGIFTLDRVDMVGDINISSGLDLSISLSDGTYDGDKDLYSFSRATLSATDSVLTGNVQIFGDNYSELSLTDATNNGDVRIETDSDTTASTVLTLNNGKVGGNVEMVSTGDASVDIQQSADGLGDGVDGLYQSVIGDVDVTAATSADFNVANAEITGFTSVSTDNGNIDFDANNARFGSNVSLRGDGAIDIDSTGVDFGSSLNVTQRNNNTSTVNINLTDSTIENRSSILTGGATTINLENVDSNDVFEARAVSDSNATLDLEVTGNSDINGLQGRANNGATVNVVNSGVGDFFLDNGGNNSDVTMTNTRLESMFVDNIGGDVNINLENSTINSSSQIRGYRSAANTPVDINFSLNNSIADDILLESDGEVSVDLNKSITGVVTINGNDYVINILGNEQSEVEKVEFDGLGNATVNIASGSTLATSSGFTSRFTSDPINPNALVDNSGTLLFTGDASVDARIINRNNSTMDIGNNTVTTSNDITFESGSTLGIILSASKSGQLVVDDTSSAIVDLQDGSTIKVQVVGNLANISQDDKVTLINGNTGSVISSANIELYGDGGGVIASTEFVEQLENNNLNLAILAEDDTPTDPTDPTDPVDPTDPTDPTEPDDSDSGGSDNDIALYNEVLSQKDQVRVTEVAMRNVAENARQASFGKLMNPATESGNWVEAFGSKSSSDNPEYETEYSGISLGVSHYDDTKDANIGLSFSYLSGDIESDNDFYSYDIESIQAGVFGGKRFDNDVVLSWSSSVALNDYNSTRVHSYISGLESVNQAEYDGYQWYNNIAIQKEYAINDTLSITPIAGVDYVWSKIEDYEEEGIASNIEYDTYTNQSANVFGGVSFNLDMKAGDYAVNPYISSVVYSEIYDQGDGDNTHENVDVSEGRQHYGARVENEVGIAVTRSNFTASLSAGYDRYEEGDEVSGGLSLRYNF